MIGAALPPAVLVPLALVLVLARRRWAAVATLAVFLLMATESYAVWLLGALGTPEPAAAGTAASVLIYSPPGPTPVTLAQPWLQEARAGAALARRTGLPILVAGAAAPAIAASLADEFGVTARWVVQDGKNPSSAIDASVSALRSSAIGSVYLVTTAWEWGGLQARLQRAGMTVVAPLVPTPIKRRGSLLDWVPVASTLMDSESGARAALERVATPPAEQFTGPPVPTDR